MLSHLSIQNMAIIEALELDLNSNMTVLTGETGAGKSIIIDAISLLIGDRSLNGSYSSPRRDGGSRRNI